MNATTVVGQDIYVAGDIAALGTWESGANRTGNVPSRGMLTLSDTWRS